MWTCQFMGNFFETYLDCGNMRDLMSVLLMSFMEFILTDRHGQLIMMHSTV